MQISTDFLFHWSVELEVLIRKQNKNKTLVCWYKLLIIENSSCYLFFLLRDNCYYNSVCVVCFHLSNVIIIVMLSC